MEKSEESSSLTHLQPNQSADQDHSETEDGMNDAQTDNNESIGLGESSANDDPSPSFPYQKKRKLDWEGEHPLCSKLNVTNINTKLPNFRIFQGSGPTEDGQVQPLWVHSYE